MPPQVVGIGSCGIDYFAIVPRLLGPDEKINADRLEIHAGGVTGNNLTQVARLGATAGWLGLIGDDESGRLIVKAFEVSRASSPLLFGSRWTRRANAASTCSPM
jgi:sugar/nucleoside kinase (ribokinase family)